MLMILFMTFSLLFLPKKYKSLNWLNSLVSLFMLTLMMLTKMTLWGPMNITINQWLYMDSLSFPLIALTLWISALMILASFSIKIKKTSEKFFLNLILFLNFTLLSTFSMSNILLFYISFESTLIPTLFIILGWGYQPERLQAGFYLMIYTILASLPLLISITLMFKNNNTLLFSFNFMTTPSTFMLSIWWFITILAFFTKMPLYTVHLWLPKAHVEAPVAGSMILAGLLLKLGSYGLLRLSYLFSYANKLMTPFISSIAMWGAIITSMICLRQPDMKSLIAYSSIGHMALLTAGIMTNSLWGWNSAIMMMIAHGLCSSALFALANMQYEATLTRNIYLTKGMLALFPVMTMLWFIMSSGNMSAPPSMNLIAEIILITSIMSLNMLLAPILATTAFLSAAYSLYLYTTTQHGTPSAFISAMQLFMPRNYLTIIMHLLPLFLMSLKMELFTLN
uniref:NADH-ubiquinone oxidoreductase chain 4 n=1 Tax=Neoamphitrite affinis TaxID=2716569 RepID=A0A8F9RU43_9ANNE|nr:NADH dehydrogenase subunit 4 [Neoamphitrite affinis]